jgi:gliding motility-associated-like protein
VENNDNIKELFKEKLGDFEANVRPEIWSSISSQISSAPAAVGTLGSSFLAKGVVVFSFVAAVGAIVYFSSTKTEATENSPNETKSQKLTVTEARKEQTQKAENTGIESIVDVEKDQPSKTEFAAREENNRFHAREENKENTIFIENVYNRFDEIESVQAVPVSQTILENSIVVNDKMETNTVVKPFITEVLSNISEANTETYKLDLPNVFTPNNDGINDIFKVNTVGLTEFSLVVLDQRNKIIFSTQDSNVSWDGLSLSGEPVSSGNYVYFITARDASGNLITKHSLLRIER